MFFIFACFPHRWGQLLVSFHPYPSPYLRLLYISSYLFRVTIILFFLWLSLSYQISCSSGWMSVPLTRAVILIMTIQIFRGKFFNKKRLQTDSSLYWWGKFGCTLQALLAPSNLGSIISLHVRKNYFFNVFDRFLTENCTGQKPSSDRWHMCASLAA